MSYLKKIPFFLLLIPLMGCGDDDENSVSVCPSDGPMATASYRVTFKATWSEETHPVDFPSNPHFSGLIGTTHNEDFSMWMEGELATPGIENMAETGSKNPLDTEIDTAISNGTAKEKISGGGINPSPGSTSLSFFISSAYPLVSLVSMVAPSPDWFVGVKDLSLCEDNRWIDEKTVSLLAYDAGTDDGLTFDAPDADSTPHEPISLIETSPLAPGGSLIPLGTFTFTKL